MLPGFSPWVWFFHSLALPSPGAAGVHQVLCIQLNKEERESAWRITWEVLGARPGKGKYYFRSRPIGPAFVTCPTRLQRRMGELDFLCDRWRKQWGLMRTASPWPQRVIPGTWKLGVHQFSGVLDFQWGTTMSCRLSLWKTLGWRLADGLYLRKLFTFSEDKIIRCISGLLGHRRESWRWTDLLTRNGYPNENHCS